MCPVEFQKISENITQSTKQIPKPAVILHIKKFTISLNKQTNKPAANKTLKRTTLSLLSYEKEMKYFSASIYYCVTAAHLSVHKKC